jgi:hypothetical protein
LKVKTDRIIKSRLNVGSREAYSVLNNLTRNVNKKTYLEEFNARVNGPLHEQPWVKVEALQFHKQMANRQRIFVVSVKKMIYYFRKKMKWSVLILFMTKNFLIILF